ncbi:recombination regulator RecX [Candidimonas nitroreducens]|uniref:Regulatory protein RecX n=1 Tax=Candidimonas nitroreducens TaxID=683354 RepID=A0A225LVQ6_9BURK|nr:recombination regulator RecX [Candidimonas nitroreducens]OWT53405.1 recombination regulator RecX [Candidimonas nitroreducens]
MPRTPDDDPFETPGPRSLQGAPRPLEPFEQLAAVAAGQPAAALSGRSLKARAVAYLSRREYSRQELRRKLLPNVADADELDLVLDQLEHERWLSDERYAQALVHRKAARQGTARIVQELRRQGVPDENLEAVKAQLQGTEIERARQVWRKKFSGPPQDAREYARQFRFLASRGFSPECLRRILGEQDDVSST